MWLALEELKTEANPHEPQLLIGLTCPSGCWYMVGIENYTRLQMILYSDVFFDMRSIDIPSPSPFTEHSLLLLH